jgi:hypothetical protein
VAGRVYHLLEGEMNRLLWIVASLRLSWRVTAEMRRRRHFDALRRLQAHPAVAARCSQVLAAHLHMGAALDDAALDAMIADVVRTTEVN